LLENILRGLFMRRGRPILVASILTLLGCFAARADAVEEVKALNRQAGELYGKGEYAEAFRIGERALSLAEKTLGAEHIYTLTSVSNLATFYLAQGRYSGPSRSLSGPWRPARRCWG
jgi:hypothetical protein